MTNYGALAILALPKMPYRQRYLLLALETVTSGSDGWRPVGLDLLARSAGLSVRTAVKARDELTKAGFIEWRRGTGREHPSVYRLRFDLSNPGKNAATVNPGKPGSATLANAPRNPVSRNAASSGNASGALEPIALEPSALSRAARDLGAALAGLGADDDEIDEVFAAIKRKPGIRSSLAAYMRGVVNGDGGARLLDEVRRDHAADDPDDPRPPPKPPWCRECDERTRLIGLPDGRMARCIRCHPFSVHPPGKEPARDRRPPWCGECDEPTRLREIGTEDGLKVRKCPQCHPSLARGQR